MPSRPTQVDPPARSRVGRNTVAQLAGKTSWMVVSLLITPYLFARLGARSFGTWSLLAGLASTAMLLDLGLTPAVIRLVAGAESPAACRRASRGLGLALQGFVAIAAVLTIPVWLGLAPLVHLLHLEGIAHLHAALLLTLAAVAATGLGVPFTAILDGRQRMELTATATGLGSLAYGAATVVLLALGGGLLAPAVGLLAYAAVRAAVACLLARRGFPELRPRLRGHEAGMLRELLRFGSRVQVTNLTAVVNLESDRWVIAGVASPVLVAPYDLAIRIMSLLRLLATFSLLALYPPAAAAHARGDREALDRLYRQVTRRLSAVSAGVVCVLVVAAGPLLALWIGRPLPFAVHVIWVFAPASGFNVCTGALSLVLRATGQPGRETAYSVLSMVLNLLLTVVFLAFLGPLGAVAGSAAGIALASLYTFWSFHRATGRPLAPVASVLARTWLAAAAACAGGLLLAGVMPPLAGRLAAAEQLVVLGSITLAGYLAALWAGGFWSAEERARLRALRPAAVRGRAVRAA